MHMPDKPSKNGMSIAGGKPESVRNTTGCTELGTKRVMKNEMGASMKAMMQNTAPKRAERSGSSSALRRMK